MREGILLAVVAAWLALLAFGALVVRRELGLLQERLATIGTAATDGAAVGSFAPRVPQMRRDDVLLFLFGDCAPCHEVATEVGRTLDPRRFLCVLNDGTVAGSAASVTRFLPAGARTVVGAPAQRAREELKVNSAPFGIAVVAGLITAKGTIRHAGDLAQLAAVADRRPALPMAGPASRAHAHAPAHPEEAG